MPTITPADALIKALDKLMDAISGTIPKNSITKDAILQLMSIYCQQALDASDAKSAQRVVRCLAEAQRLQTEKEDAKDRGCDQKNGQFFFGLNDLFMHEW